MINRTFQNRNEFLDFLRGGAILLVVFGHAIQVCMNMDISDPVHVVIRTFQMNLLMIISGYSVKYSKKELKFAANIKSKVNRLLIPYIVWAEIHYCIGVLINSKDVQGLNPFSVLFVSQFWFLRILFFIYLAYYICQFAVEKLNYRYGVILGIFSLVIISTIPGNKLVLWYAPFFLIGVIIGKVKFSKLMLLTIGRICTIIFSCSIFLLLSAKNTLFLSMIDKSMTISGSAAVAYISYLIYNKTNEWQIIKSVQTIGVNTLPIYAIHWCLFFSYKLFVVKIADDISVYPSAFLTAIV